MTPLISVIMPVYNAAEDYLRTAMESILQQTCGDFEFIIINDGSTNNTESVILSYDDKRIRYVKNDRNLQITASLNKGLGLANGEYIARIDADDYSDKLRFEKQINIMNNNDKIGLAGTYTIEIPTNEEIVPPTDDKDMKLLLKYCTNCIVHSSVMLRKSVLDEHNLKYNPKALHAEDYRLWCDMADYCEFTTIPEFIHYYRIAPEGISATNAGFQKKMARAIIWDNMIKDFAKDKRKMYSIIAKCIQNAELSSDERKSLLELYESVNEYLNKNLSATFLQFACTSINALKTAILN